MDRTIFLPTAALGAAFIMLYGFRCWKHAEAMNVGTLVNIMMQSGGMTVGGFLILSTLVPELKQRLTGVDIYIFIAGLAVLAVWAEALKRDLLPAGAAKLPGMRSEPQPLVAVATTGEVARVASGGSDRAA